MITVLDNHDQAVRRIAEQHAEAALCHLAHIAGITFGDVAFDRDRDQLAVVIASYLVDVDRRARGLETSENVDQLETYVAEFGQIDNASVSAVERDEDGGYTVGVVLHRVGRFSRTYGCKFTDEHAAVTFREDALEIIGRAT